MFRDGREFTTRWSWLFYNGRTEEHRVAPFEGERNSIVLFTRRGRKPVVKIPAPRVETLGASLVTSEVPEVPLEGASGAGFDLAFPLADVEPGYLRKVPSTMQREYLAKKARELWDEEVKVKKMGAQPLPPMVDCDNIRGLLKQAQESSKETKVVMEQLRIELDPESARKRTTGESKAKGALKPLELKTFRLSPVDGVLEKEVNLAVEVLFVPYIPDVQVATEAKPLTWRRWLFEQCHCTFMEPHRRAGPTYDLLRRVGWWPNVVHDFNKWYWSCPCRRHRARGVQGPLRSILADEGRAELLPWTDVIIDVQGPFTKSELGNQYVLSWHCTCLKVPKLCAFSALQQGPFLRAVTVCMLKTRTVPDVWRSDRGPEMVNEVQDEFRSILSAKHVKGASLTPRHQGLGERGHQENLTNHMILMKQICDAYPQEWCSLIESLEYLYDIEPQGDFGLSAHDMATGYALVGEVDRRLAPFTVPGGVAQTSLAARVFDRFRGLYGIFSRSSRHRAQQIEDTINRRRNLRVFDEGELVYRKKPAFARPPKQQMSDPVAGPYEVARQSTTSSVVLRDPETGKEVDDGANIPLEQILAGPRRPAFRLEEGGEQRSIGAMIRSEGGAGAKPGRRSGWGGLAPGAYVAYQTVPSGPKAKELTVGKVLSNDREGQTVQIQPHRAQWSLVKIVHRPLYQSRDGQVVAPIGVAAADTVRY
ncbi:MAG: integrase zinc binding domain-containing protein, partial [Pseudomonadota bacterium]|nr:integrase zinc binding domain-containing protein [Pseudomonadota bacterium]